MTYTIDLASLLAQTFVSNINLYAISPQALEAAQNTQIEIGTYAYEASDVEGEGTSILGLPVLQTIGWTSENGDKWDAADFGDALVSFNMTRLVVKTPMQGNDGTTKEFIANGDWDVKIQGLLVSTNPYQAPLDLMAKFKYWFVDKKEALGVVGKKFDTLGIHNLVVENALLNVVPGMINVVPFELHCISDLDYSLQIQTGQN